MNLLYVIIFIIFDNGTTVRSIQDCDLKFTSTIL